MRSIARPVLLLAPLALAACGSGSGDPPGATSAREAQALNDAAEMLDANSVEANSVDPDIGNQEQPE